MKPKHKNGHSVVEYHHKRKSSKSKNSKRSLSKKSIGSTTKKSSYSTSKIKDHIYPSKSKYEHSHKKSNYQFVSLMSQRFKNSEAVKYNSFVSSCKISPSRTKSTEKVPKKSQRKLDLNTIRTVVGSRKKSYCGSSTKNSIPSSITSTIKKQPKEHTRNIPKMEDIESKSHYSNIMNSYSEIMSNKRKVMKKYHRKQLSKSFYMGGKNALSTSKEASTQSKYKACKKPKTACLNRFYTRRNTADNHKPKQEKVKRVKVRMGVIFMRVGEG
jgi:hypothetical protein